MLGVFYDPIKSNGASSEQEEITDETNRRRRRRSTDEKIDVDKIDPEFCVVVKPPPPTPAPTLGPGAFVDIPPVITNTSLNFTVSITNAKCVFWDPDNQTWTSNGCVVRLLYEDCN